MYVKQKLFKYDKFNGTNNKEQNVPNLVYVIWKQHCSTAKSSMSNFIINSRGSPVDCGLSDSPERHGNG